MCDRGILRFLVATHTEPYVAMLLICADVTELVITDAQKKQVSCREKMNKLELESLLSKRDVLMAQGGMYKLIDFETQRNITNLESEVSNNHVREVVLFSEVTNVLSLWEVLRGCPLLRGN